MAVGSVVGTVAAYAAIASAAAGIAATAYGATQSAPKGQSASSASKEVANAQASALPLQRMLQALEQQGGKFNGTSKTVIAGKKVDKPGLMGIINALDPIKSHNISGTGIETAMALDKNAKQRINSHGYPEGSANAIAAELKKQGKTDASAKAQYQVVKDAIKAAKKAKTDVTLYQDAHGNYVPQSIGTADFTGYGTADIQGQLARQNAENQIALGDKYGVAFAEEAKREAELADPEGTAARKAQYDMIQQSLENPLPINPLSRSLESGVQSQLAAGSGLDANSQSLLDSAVQQANATRGGGASSQAVADDIASGIEGRARKEAGIGKAQAFLNSGSSPADIQTRRQQTDLGNLADFIGGRTPQSQFAGISAAGRGAAPYVQGQPGAQLAGNAGSLGNAYSTAAYSANVNNSISQANPWMAGLSSLLSASGAAVKSTA